MFFKDACRKWMDDKSKEVKATSLAAYSLIIDHHLLPRFKTLEEITPETVRKMVDESIRKHLKNNTIRNLILVTKMIIKYCEIKGWKEHQE